MGCINRNVMARWASPPARAGRANWLDGLADKCVMVRRERKGEREGGRRGTDGNKGGAWGALTGM